MKSTAKTLTELMRARTYTSALIGAGHQVIVRAPAGARIKVAFRDRANGEDLDVTDWLPDLILLGWTQRVEVAEGQSAPAPEQVDLATIVIEPANVAPLVSATYIHLPARETMELPLEQALELASEGVAVQFSAAVAHEAAADDPDLDNPDAAGQASA